MISVPFVYPKDSDLKIEIRFQHWLSKQNDFSLWVGNEKLEESEPGSEIYVAQVGEKLFAIRYKQDQFVPKLVIEKEEFSIGSKLGIHDYIIAVVFILAFLFGENLLLERPTVVLLFVFPTIYYLGRYLSISQHAWRRWKIGLFSVLVLVFSLFFLFRGKLGF